MLTIIGIFSSLQKVPLCPFWINRTTFGFYDYKLVFGCSWTVFKWNHTVCNFLSLAFFLSTFLTIFHVAWVKSSLQLLSSISLLICQTLFIISPVYGYFSCFQYLVIMNKVAIHICVQFFCGQLIFKNL